MVRGFLAWVTLAVIFAGTGLAKNAGQKSEKELILGIPCAAFAQDGRWATAVFAASSLRVQLGGPPREARFYDLPVVLKATTEYFPVCRLFFSPAGQYLAVSQRLADEREYRLHIAVLDTGTGKWISSFDVHPQDALQSYFRLAGFLRNTDKLVVTGLSNRNPRAEKVSFSSALFSVEGIIANPVGSTRSDPPGLIGGWADVDAKHNRVWGSGWSTATPCHWHSVTLTGPLAYGPKFDQHAVGNVACGGFFVAFPDDNTIVGAGDNSNHGWAWRVDLPTDTGEKLQLPESELELRLYRNWYNVRRGSLSPDGRIFVVDRDLARDVFDRFYPQPDVLTAVQVRPLRVLGTIQLKGVCPVRALAADHRNGNVKALIYACGKWETVSIPPGSRK